MFMTYHHTKKGIKNLKQESVDRDSVVNIVTGYDVDGPWIESCLVRDIPDRSKPAFGPTQPPVQWV